MPATTDQVQAVIDGTAPCPRDTDGLPELIGAATDVQWPLLRGRVFEQYGPFAGDLIWRRAEASTRVYRDEFCHCAAEGWSEHCPLHA